MRATSEQSIPEELVQRIGDLAARFSELSEYVQRAKTNARDVRTNDAGNCARPIEFLTENGFAIVRRWETDGSSVPANGSFCFLVRDPDGAESEINTEIANQLIAETEFRTRGHIQLSSSFWICCAERHLADYLEEHEHVPDNNKLTLEILNCEAVMLAFRWERSAL